MDAMVIWMAEQPLKVGRSYLVKNTTKLVKARCAQIFYRLDLNTLNRQDTGQLGLNEIGRVRLTLFRPLYVGKYRRGCATGSFILIDPLTKVMIAAGMVMDRLSAAQI